MQELKTMSTVDLINLICNIKDQLLINKIAYELTCRIYVPNQEKTFEEMLYSFGYVKEVNKQLIK